jgi:phosphoglycerate dehydrogenase-like enzyme
LAVLVPRQAVSAALAHVELDPIAYDVGCPMPSAAATAKGLLSLFRSLAEFDAELAAAPGVEYVQLVSSGYDGIVDHLPAGVGLGTARGANGQVVAELALGLLIASFRRLDEAGAQGRRGRLMRPTGQSVFGSKLVVLGAGDMAVQFRARAEACGATVRLTGRTARAGVDGIGQVLDLLGEADAVVSTLPLNGQTRGLVDARFLARMKDGAVLVNVGRGAVVSTPALVAELRSGRLRAALDVTDPEPLPPDHELWTLPGAIVTPHVGGAVKGFFDRAYAVGLDQLAQYARGLRPTNRVL